MNLDYEFGRMQETVADLEERTERLEEKQHTAAKIKEGIKTASHVCLMAFSTACTFAGALVIGQKMGETINDFIHR